MAASARALGLLAPSSAAAAAAAAAGTDGGADSMPRCTFCGTPKSTGATHAELTQNLRRNGLLTSPALEAYAAVDRHMFMVGACLR